MNQPQLSWTLISDQQALPARGFLQEKDVLQLKGIFLSLDDDSDGYLTKEQLQDALVLLGLNTRDKLLSKFFNISHHSKAAVLKVDLKTFLSVLSKEKEKFRDVEKDLDYIFSYLDPHKTGQVNRQELKHFLVELDTPLRLTAPEFSKFLKTIPVSSTAKHINIDVLKKRIMFGMDNN